MTVEFNSLDFGHQTHKACGSSSFITEAYNFKEILNRSGQPKGPMKQKQMAVEKNPCVDYFEITPPKCAAS